MANRRPPRAPRQGWRRGRRRPTRWIDCFSASLNAGLVMGAGSINPGHTTKTQSYRELVVGNLDTEWADANEVVVERIVGQISVSGKDLYNTGADAEQVYGNWGFLLPTARLGLIVVEDVDDSAASLDIPSLWEADDLQDGEWMWLFQLGSPNETHIVLEPATGDTVRLWTHDISIDVRVKRKLGRRDRLVLCHDFSLRTETFGGTHAVSVHPLLRGLVSTK